MLRHLAFLLCLISFACAGQTKGAAAVEKVDTANYLGYYRQIAAAEKALVSAQYDEALQIYMRTFRAYSFNNPIDCYVAAQVAAFRKDSARTETLLERAVAFGVPKTTIANNVHLQKAFLSMPSKVFDSCTRAYENRINQEARSRIISLSRCDQQFIKGKTIYDKSDFKLQPKYQPFWDSLVIELKAIIKAYGFPAQKVVGTQAAQDSLFKTNPHANYAYFILVHHCDGWKIIGDLLHAELQKGNISPQMFAAIYEYSNGEDARKLPIQYFSLRPCQDKRCAKALAAYGIEKANENRSKIGLCSIEVMEKKFASNRKYYDRPAQQTAENFPYFDFKCDLNFFQE